MFDATPSQVVTMHIVILGGGISGLTAAWKAKQAGAEITLLEKSDRAGGWIKTVNHEGFLFELGPRSCRPSGIATVQLAEELGIKDQIITASSDAYIRYLYYKNKLRKVPGIWMWKWIPTLLCEPFRKKGTTEETVGQFFTRRFSKDIAENIIDPMVSGIYAGNLDELSLQSAFPIFKQWEQEHGSILLGALKHKPEKSSIPGIFSFRDGMETLTKALYEKLKEHIHLNSPVTKINLDDLSIETPDQTFHADHIISAIPPGNLLPIPQIPCASIAVVNIGYRKKVLKHKGFGYLIPRNVGSDVLGAIWDSSAFPQQNSHPDETRITVMIGRRLDQDLVSLALDTLKHHLGITERPDAILCTTMHNAIPQYGIGHHKILKTIESISPHFTAIGNSFYGIAVNDCVSHHLGSDPK